MAPDDIRTLSNLITSTLTLLTQFSSTLTTSASTQPPPTTTTTTPTSSTPNPLHILRDAATLLKAQTTKLSLLAINPPFTPTAITKVLRETSTTCLPALLSATQLLSDSPTHSTTLASESRTRVRRVFHELAVLLHELASITNAAAGTSSSSSSSSPSSQQKSPAASTPRSTRDSLAATGVVWESCDAVTALSTLGEGGLAARLGEQWRETIRDAGDELREWREGSDGAHEGREDALLDSEDEGVGGDDDLLEDIFNAANSLPADRPELRELAVRAEGVVKRVVLLYTAVVKRRCKTFVTGEGTENAERLDRVMGVLRRLPNEVDALVADCFYNLDEDAAKSKIDEIVALAKTVPVAVETNWEGKEDEFTAWTKKWEEAIG